MARELPIRGFDDGGVVLVETDNEIPYRSIGVVNEDQGTVTPPVGGATGLESLYYKTTAQGANF